MKDSNLRGLEADAPELKDPLTFIQQITPIISSIFELDMTRQRRAVNCRSVHVMKRRGRRRKMKMMMRII